VLLATNMISVGVDVPRLGLMAVVGQPKATSEYIQAASRVGRSAAGPGLVLTIYNWARPRDLSHYETFEQYQATFFSHVEALSVTPFAPRAIDRGLTTLMVSLIRHGRIGAEGADWNPEPGAQVVPTGSSQVEDALAAIVARAGHVTGEPAVEASVRAGTDFRRERWGSRQATAANSAAALTYRGRLPGTQALLRHPVAGQWDEFSVPMSLRETEPTINLQIDLWDHSLEGAPGYRLAVQLDGDSAGEGATPPDGATPDDAGRDGAAASAEAAPPADAAATPAEAAPPEDSAAATTTPAEPS
jgi:hypothetical protein